MDRDAVSRALLGERFAPLSHAFLGEGLGVRVLSRTLASREQAAGSPRRCAP